MEKGYKMAEKKLFIIGFFDGLVGYDNEPCISLDHAMQFDTLESAEKACKELQEEWQSKLTVSEVSFED